MKRLREITLRTLAAALAGVMIAALVPAQEVDYVLPPKPDVLAEAARYLDPAAGRTAEELVALALERNADLAAMRKEADAAEALIRQAGLRPNPSVAVNGTRQIAGMDNSLMVEGSIPLELYGRRGARLAVAAREAEVRRSAVAEKERLLAAEVRSRFGEALAFALKLRFTAEMLGVATDNLGLVAASVREGRRAPLEQNLETVELNRLRAMFETAKGKTETALFELRNLAGFAPDEPLRLQGDLEKLLGDLPSVETATLNALGTRPDLAGARLVESLAEARIRQAEIESRPEAELMAGYQRMTSGFPLQGFDDAGTLRPIEQTMNFFTFGVKITLPVRNRNQGMIAAATAEREAAARRREFGEVSIRNEVASAYAQYRAAARSMEIYRVGVRELAAANLNVVRQTYELGSRTLFDYIAEQRRFIEIEGSYIDARLETYLARVAVLRAANLGELVKK
jgi:cobalt-zinc-cadmium efflux system outer membrane protein